ncbi:MAG: TLD domain-containing protein [Methanosphaera sp.]|nr:TLD domain-containing protein [Methanosphaera sp.]
MESKTNKYQLTQKNGSYILLASIVGNDIKLTIKNSGATSSEHTRIFTVDTWKRIGAVFSSINTADDALQWINNAMKVHKVKIVEAGTLVKLIFVITEANKTRHYVEIPISGDGQMASSMSANYTTSSFATANIETSQPQAEFAQQDFSQYMQQGTTTATTTTTTTTTNTTFNLNEFGIDPSKIVKQTVNPNTAEIISSIEAEQKLRLSQVGKITTENYVPEVKVEIPYKVVEKEVREPATTTTNTTNFDMNQFTTTTVPETTTNTYTDTTTNFDMNQFTTTTVPETTTNTYTDTTTNFDMNQFTTTTVPETTTNTYTDTTTNFDMNQFTTTETTNVDTTTTTTSFNAPYITPADEIKTETTPVDFNLDSYTQNNNYAEYQATTTTNTQYDTTQDFTNTQLTGFDSTVPDDRLFKLEGDATNLKNEHQEIQYKLTNLTNQVSLYKNQLESLEKEKNNRELIALRNENAQIKQQLSELSNLRKAASEVQVLRERVAQLDPLRRKAAEADALQGQLNELNMLRMKVAELSGIQNQLGELNNLKAQVGQMNLMKQQMDELNMLKAKVEELSRNNMKSNAENDEKEMLKRKLQELENLKNEYEQEIKTLRENKTTVATKVQESSGLEKKQLLFEERAQQISVKGDIIHSTEELELITRKINKANKKITLNLLYKATVDSDKAEAFHDKCDQAQSSLVLVETDKGKRFGGFTSCSWAGECIEKKDEDAFIFSLDKMQVYENIPGEEAIGCYPKFGPIFLGCQIRIYDNAFAKGGTTFEKGLNYNTEEDFELTGGERIFGIKEIEVYEVIAQ